MLKVWSFLSNVFTPQNESGKIKVYRFVLHTLSEELVRYRKLTENQAARILELENKLHDKTL